MPVKKFSMRDISFSDGLMCHYSCDFSSKRLCVPEIAGG
jgi:hypothetical protein